MLGQAFLTRSVRQLTMALSSISPWSGTWRSLWKTACSSRKNFILPDKFQMRDVVINVSHRFCCQHIRIDHCRPFLNHHKFRNCDGGYYFGLMSNNFLTFKPKAARQSDFRNLRMSPIKCRLLKTELSHFSIKTFIARSMTMSTKSCQYKNTCSMCFQTRLLVSDEVNFDGLLAYIWPVWQVIYT